MYAVSSRNGRIGSFAESVGLLVFKSKNTDSKKVYHVGVYAGGGYIIETKGHECGAVRTRLDARETVGQISMKYLEKSI